jgi:hypothetical protein
LGVTTAVGVTAFEARAEEVEDRKCVTCAVKEWGALTTYHLVLPRYRHKYVQWRSPVVPVNRHPEVMESATSCSGEGGMRDREGGKVSCRAQFSNSAHNFGNRANQSLSSCLHDLATHTTLLITLGCLTIPESKMSASQRPKFETFSPTVVRGTMDPTYRLQLSADFPPEIVSCT